MLNLNVRERIQDFVSTLPNTLQIGRNRTKEVTITPDEGYYLKEVI